MKNTQLSQTDRIAAAIRLPERFNPSDSRRLAVFYSKEIEKHREEISRHTKAIEKLTALRQEETDSIKRSS